jgi:hypothetical protein
MHALSALGVAPENPSFPNIVACPSCHQNTLYLFDDIAANGVWLHCNTCGAHGDIITFAASIWNTSIADAIDKFVDLRLISAADKTTAINEYSRAVQKQAHLQDFWADTEPQIWSHGDDVIACRLRELGVSSEINARGFVGVAHKEQIAKVCAEIGRPCPKNFRRGGASIVFPFYDLPGRFAGAMLVQYSEDFDARYNYIPVNGYKRKRPEAGYFLLDAMLKPAPEILKNTQFVVDSPMWALQMQCEQLKRGVELLPIAASYTGPEANSYGQNWLAFAPITRLFQSAAISPELISRAATARGYVCVTPPLHKKTREQDNPLKQLTNIRYAATTWQVSLHNALKPMSEIAAQSFATRLTVSPDKLAPFLKKMNDNFSAGFADRVLSHATLAVPLGSIQTARRRVVIARGDGWWNSANHRICSANIAITKIVQEDNGHKTYSGVIHIDGEQFEFSDSAKRIEGMGLLAYAQAYMAPKKKLVVFDNMWNKRSHLISIELNKPELISISSRLGWDDRAGVFRFAQFELTNDGAVTPTMLPKTKKQSAAFPEPTPVAPPAIKQFLTPSPDNAFIWTVFAAIATDLIAPVVRKEPTATGMSGASFTLAAMLGNELACSYKHSTTLHRSHVSRNLAELAENADWPLFAASTFDDASYGTVIPRCHAYPIFVKITQPAAAIAPSYGWQVITGSASVGAADFSVFRHVLPAYIQRALKQRMTIAAGSVNMTRAVLSDLAGWLTETYGSSFQLDCALNQLVTDENAHTALLLELGRAVNNRQLTIVPHPRNRSQAANYLVRKKDYWWLNQRAVDRYFYSSKTVIPNWLLIKELLLKSGALIAEESIRGMPGISITTDWGDQFLLTNSEARDIG